MSVGAIEKNNISSELRAIRLAREKLGITRQQLAKSPGISYKAVEKIENGRMALSNDRKNEILNLLGIDEYRLKRIKKAGIVIPTEKIRTVFENSQRRSYKRIIIKEVRVLKLLRNMKNIAQDKASSLCGYSRPTIGHIENGRIEIPLSRIRHIVISYGYEYSKFEELMKEEVLRDEIIESCTQKLLSLPEDKLKLVQSVLANF
jgi:transcriptional regulator with XRE-family HTH domain